MCKTCYKHLYKNKTRYQPACKPNLSKTLYQAPTYLKSHGKFHEDVSIAKCHSNEEMCRFSEKIRVQLKMLFWMGKKRVGV